MAKLYAFKNAFTVVANNWTWERGLYSMRPIYIILYISIMQSRRFSGPVKYFTVGWYFDVQPRYGTIVKTGNPLLQLLAHCWGSLAAFIVSHFTFISSHKVSQCFHKVTEYQYCNNLCKSMDFLHDVGQCNGHTAFKSNRITRGPTQPLVVSINIFIDVPGW